MSVIRILIVDLPPLVEEFMAQELEKQPDMKFRRVEGPAHALDDWELQGDFDVVLTSIEFLRALSAPHGMHGVSCPIPVVGISRDGKEAELYDIKVIREVSTEIIVGAIREVVNAGGLTWTH